MLLTVGLIASIGVLFRYVPFADWNFVDLRAFYCAGHIANIGGDPYRYEPLRTCEADTLLAPTNPSFVVPAPLPGYVIAAFRPLSLVPFQAVAALYVLEAIS